MCHVLIIEDEPLIASLLRELLEDEGATSFGFAETQQAAIDAAILCPPALITSDVKLTTGTGPLAVEAIHQQLGKIPVIFITSTPTECEPLQSSCLVLCKPVDQSELASAFHRLTEC